jgi:hypothetical protein
MKTSQNIAISTFVLISLFLCTPVKSAQILQNDPFKQPALVQNLESNKNQEKQRTRETWLPELRATMRAGVRSMANINGHIVIVGELIDGFKLVEVTERDAFFIKDGFKYHVSMDQESNQTMEQ